MIINHQFTVNDIFLFSKQLSYNEIENGEFTMKDFDEKLGAALRKARQAKKLSQPEVAEKLGVSKMTVSYWETGMRTMKAEQLKRYCALLGVSAQSILDQTD